jgi:hypothetical protein
LMFFSLWIYWTENLQYSTVKDIAW